MFSRSRMLARRSLREGISQEWKGKASLNTVLGCTFALTRYIFGNDVSQSELSEELGFNRRLLSKYELGTSNISYSTYLYIFQCLNANSYVSNNILRTVVEQLASQGIYVYLNLDNVSLANNEPSTLERPYVSKSYKYVMDWFGLQYDIKIKVEEFNNLQETEYKELFGMIKNIFVNGDFEKMRREHREAHKASHKEKLINELNNTKLEYATLLIDKDFSPKELSEEEIQKRDLLLENLSRIKKELDSLRTRPGMIPRNLDNGDSYNKVGFDNFYSDL